MTRSGKWLTAILGVAIALGVTGMVLQNLQLKTRLAAERSVRAQLDSLRTTNDRMIGEASMAGRCRPFLDRNSRKPESSARPALDVSLYFSLRYDCPSCIAKLIREWNGAVRGGALTVTGYAEVDGTEEEKMLAGWGPAFPIVRVAHIKQKLTAAGLAFTPAVVVSDATTGRILLAYDPAAADQSEDSMSRRLQSLALPCTQ